jgi:L-2-hydroxyglutarate oxidase LhgO
MENVDAVVIGAGVIGLALARELALRGHETLILEAASRFGTGVSARNSEVIHAGIYHPPDFLKSRLCIAGRERLYEYCRKRSVGHRRCGKLIVASGAAQLPALANLAAAARANGVDLVALEGAQARRMEPELACEAALYSPLTGIVDCQNLMLALLGEAEASGATLSTGSAVTRVVLESASAALGVNGCEPDLRARILINAAGLQAPELARAMENLPCAEAVPKAYYARGNYFRLNARSPFRHLIYPLPEPGGAGIHLTLDLAGEARFGPDVEWIETPDYEVSPARAARFETVVRAYWPGLPAGALQPAYAGVRPKIVAAGEPEADFRIDDENVHGVPGLINLFGIESPGLTASLAIASEAVSRIDQSL